MREPSTVHLPVNPMSNVTIFITYSEIVIVSSPGGWWWLTPLFPPGVPSSLNDLRLVIIKLSRVCPRSLMMYVLEVPLFRRKSCLSLRV